MLRLLAMIFHMNLNDNIFAVRKATSVSVEKDSRHPRWSVRCIAAQTNGPPWAALDAFYPPSRKRESASTLK